MSESAAQQRARYPLAAYNFRVTVGDAAMSFSEVSGLVREHQTLVYKHGLSYWEGEEIVKFRYDKYVQVTLKKGVVAGATQLYRWLESLDKKSLSVSLCDEKGAEVVVWRINPVRTARVASTIPAQVALTWLNRRCSIGFHLLAPVG